MPTPRKNKKTFRKTIKRFARRLNEAFDKKELRKVTFRMARSVDVDRQTAKILQELHSAIDPEGKMPTDSEGIRVFLDKVHRKTDFNLQRLYDLFNEKRKLIIFLERKRKWFRHMELKFPDNPHYPQSPSYSKVKATITLIEPRPGGSATDTMHFEMKRVPPAESEEERQHTNWINYQLEDLQRRMEILKTYLPKRRQ